MIWGIFLTFLLLCSGMGMRFYSREADKHIEAYEFSLAHIKIVFVGCLLVQTLICSVLLFKHLFP